MLKDLLRTAHARQSRCADVVVIGAGIAGLLLSTRLAKLGIRTLVLESGSAAASDDLDPLNDVVQVGQPYKGATVGRYRGLGGTSTRWGGAMLPFVACDLGPHTAGWPVDWPLTLDELEPSFPEIERLFDLPEGPYEVDRQGTWSLADGSFAPRSAKWPAFRLRNVAHTLRESIYDNKLLEIWLNATVTRFELAESGRIAKVIAVSRSGCELEVEAGIVAVAAGAIESTRLLLLLDAQRDSRIFGPDRQLGHYFFDHLSTAAGTIEPVDLAALNRNFGMRFVGSGMRDLRIEPSAALRKARRFPGAFAHITAPSNTDTGSAALRAIYRSLQSGSPLAWRNVAALSLDLSWLFVAVWWRFVNRRLLYPRGARFAMVLVTEQMPNERSTIGLSENKRDPLGSPLVRIDWRTSEEDIAAFAGLQAALCQWWQSSGFAAIGRLQPTAVLEWRERLQKDSDIYHPGGTTRMGRSAATGVVDRDLKAFRVSNLYVVSTSTFPSGGSANPTLMLMALALRAANHMAGLVAQKNISSLIGAPGRPFDGPRPKAPCAEPSVSTTQ